MHVPGRAALVALVAALGCADGPGASPPDAPIPSTPASPTTPSTPGAPVAAAVADLGIPIAGGARGFTVGDVSGDGVADLIQVHGESWSNLGELRVLLGPITAARDLDAPDLVVTIAAEQLAAIGYPEVATVAGDLDGDGHDDLLVSASQWDGGYLRYAGGGSLLLPGPLSDGEAAHVVVLAPRDDSDLPGHQAAHAPLGDLDGDGLDEVAVGWPRSVTGGNVFLAGLGEPDAGLPLPQASAQATADADTFLGAELAPAGDLDGDGTVDLLVSDPLAGDVYVVHTGRWSGAVDVADLGPRLHVWDPASSNPLILSGGPPPDFDGDGRADRLLGAARIDEPLCAVFDLALAFGAVRSHGPCWSEPDDAPSSASVLGDLDGDGLDDAVLAFVGRAYLFTGAWIRDGAPLDQAVALEGSFLEVREGDLTGDGLLDLVVYGEDGTHLVPGDALAALLAP